MGEHTLGRAADDWEIVIRLLPRGWQNKARELGALRRCREFESAETLLRVLLIHLADGCSLRETAVRAAEGKLVKVSDVALFKRLRMSGEWFRWMGEQLISQWMAPRRLQPLLRSKFRVRVVDGSTVCEPGATGSTWRLHYSTHLPSLTCDEVHVTDLSVGESLTRFRVTPGDLLIADRGFANRNGIQHVHRHGGAVIVRLNLVNLPLVGPKGRPFALLRHLRRLRVGKIGDWPVWIEPDKHSDTQAIAGRVCAIKKSRAAAARAREKAIREARKQNRQIRPETVEAAGYTFVFTTLHARIPTYAVLELYRGRWQVELAFKRLKSILALGHLKKSDPQGAQAWLQGKLLVAVLIESLIALAERFSPWGYPLLEEAEQENEQTALLVAGNLSHAIPA